MVYRVYVEKKKEFAGEARNLLNDIHSFLKIEGITDLRVLQRYDVENIDEETFEISKRTIFSEPQLDLTYDHIPEERDYCFATEYLPGQYDQRADSAAQCIQMVSQGERPEVRTAKVYLLYGSVSDDELAAIKKYVINPVESREAALDRVDTITIRYDAPEDVELMQGFGDLDSAELKGFIRKFGLAMDYQDIRYLQLYFKNAHRDPTMTEIRLVDTYWSDHCRHTTFGTTIADLEFDDRAVETAFLEYLNIKKQVSSYKPVTLMDIGTIGAKYLKEEGILKNMDESEEINACTVKVPVDVDGKDEEWLFLFKNETHNQRPGLEVAAVFC